MADAPDRKRCCTHCRYAGATHPGLLRRLTCACTLISQAQVSAALEVPVSAGTPIASPSTCQWARKDRRATLTMTQPLAGKSALDRFNAGKTSTMPGISKEPVSDVADEAYYVYFSNTTRASLA